MRKGVSRAAFLRLAAGAVPASLLGTAHGQTSSAKMLTRPIPSSGEALPVVGLGTWQTFDVGTGAKERAPLTDVLRTLFEAGGSVIDSSPMYGASEAVVGDLLAATCWRR